MEQFASYIPMDRAQALARGESLPDRAQGAALFVDISGFTLLTEALVRAHGPRRGAEEITQQLNQVYTALVDEVHIRHGSVIGFAGDAMTCWFDGDDGLRAAACGLSMQRNLGQFATVPIPPSGSVSLTAKVSIAVGPARRFVVGDPDIQLIDVLAGRTLQRMALGETLAEPGEVVIDDAALHSLGERVRVGTRRRDDGTGEHFTVLEALAAAELTGPWPALLPDAFPEETIRPWVLRPVYERLSGGQGEFLAELRPAVAMFVAFGGIDYENDPAPGARLDSFVRHVQHSLARYEGFLIHVIFGDKGSYCFAAFGAPVAHDDDAARSIAAALDLLGEYSVEDTAHDSSDSVGRIGIRVGISRGRMRVGAYGGDARRAYSVLGDEANVAARLMGYAAVGQIVCTASVAAAASRQFEIEELGPVTFKGKSTPLLVSTVRGRRISHLQQPSLHFTRALVGRALELSRIEQALASVRTGAGQLLRIEGMPGVGKSHLAAELVERAIAAEMWVAVGVCQSTSHDTAYFPWRQASRSLLGLDEGADDDTASTAARCVTYLEDLAAATGRDWSVRMPLFGDLLGLPIPENATTTAFEPSLRRSVLFDLTWELVQAFCAVKPVVLLVDDVQWMDEISRSLTVSLGRALGAAPVLLALVHRPPLADQPLLPDLADLPYHCQISLNDLDEQGTTALVSARLGGEVAPLAMAVVLSEAQGNPFFTEELVDSMVEMEHLVQQSDGRWELSDALFSTLRDQGRLKRTAEEWALEPGSVRAMDLGLPDTVEGMVLARIDRLPDNAKLTLRVESVIGRVFPMDVLALAHPVRPDSASLAAEIELLLARDFARVETPSPRQSYIFKHNITHEVAYGTLLSSQQRELHRATCVALEQVAPGELGQLARHSFLGEDWERAMRYQARAGRHAQKLSANHQGIEHFRKALWSAEQLETGGMALQRMAIHSGLGEVLAATSQYDEALDHVAYALALADALGDHDARARACRLCAMVHEQRGDFAAALEWIQASLASLEGRDTVDAAEAMITGGLILNRQGDFQSAARQAERSLAIGEHLDEVTVSARAHGLLADVNWKRGDLTTVLDQSEQALNLYRIGADVHGQGKVHNIIANACYAQGRWLDADRHYRTAREIFRQTGDRYHEAIACNNLGSIARDQQHVNEAVSYYQEGLQLLDQAGGSPYMLSGIHMNLAATFIQKGDLILARAHLSIADEYVVKAQLRDFLPELYRLQAQAALGGGEFADARAEGQRSLELARELSMQGEVGRTLRVLGQIAHAQGGLEEAESLLAQSVDILRTSGEEFEEAQSQLALAQVQIGLGEGERAREALEHSSAVFQRLEAAIDLATASALVAHLPRT